MRVVGMVAWSSVGLGLLGCGLETDGSDTSFSSGYPATVSETSATSMNGDGDGDGDGDTMDGSSAGSTGSTDTGSTSNTDTGMTDTSTTGGGGPVCSGMADMSVAGSTGQADANQNCPITEYTAQVANTPGPITDVDIELSGEAATTSEVNLWLRSPGGTQVLLFDKRGNSFTDDFVGTMFDDESGLPIANQPGPFHGCYAPEQSLSAFDNQTADGTWLLRVQTCLFAASVDSWTLHLDF